MADQSNNLHPIQPAVPPKGDEQKGEKYISDLIRLIEQGKVQVHKTDLAQFNPSSLQNHYRLDLDDFQIEISHSTHLESGASSFVIIFNNLKNIADGNTEKAILAYIHLSEEQYRRFHQVAEEQIERLRKIEDEKKFIQAVRPLDERLAALESSSKDIFSEKLADIKTSHHYQEEVKPVEESYSPVVEEVQSAGQDPWSEQNTNNQEESQSEQTLGSHPTPTY